MDMRQLGRSELKVAPLAFGENIFGLPSCEKTAFSLLDKFVSAGFNLIDTADVHPKWIPGTKGGESETVIGKWLKRTGNRDKVVISTKVGMEMGPGKKGLSKAYIRTAAEASLRRLQTDRIDIYFSHEDDPHTPLQETLEAYAELIAAGKVKTIGACNYSVKRLAEAAEISARDGLPRFECVQPDYTLCSRAGYENELEKLCVQYGMGVINYCTQPSGFMSGRFESQTAPDGCRRRSDRRADTRAEFGANGPAYDQQDNRELGDRRLCLLDALDDVASKHGTSAAAVSLAWMMNRPSITAPIAGPTSVSQLDALIHATELRLDCDSLTLLDRASSACVPAR